MMKFFIILKLMSMISMMAKFLIPHSLSNFKNM